MFPEKNISSKAQTLYYSIGNLTVKSKNLDHLYQIIHRELGKVIEVKNFYIKLYSDDKSEILFPYYVDEARPPENRVKRRRAGKGLTDYVMQREKALYLQEEEILELYSKGEITLFGPMPKVWIGVPLKFDNEVIGLISVKCYRSCHTYDINDLELLDFISGQIALAIQRKKNEEKLSKQTARLKAIFESSSHTMWSINGKNQLTSYNTNYVKAIEKRYGIQLKDNGSLLNLKQELEKSDLYEFWQEKYYQAFQGNMQHFELKDRLINGRYRWREIYLNAIRLDDGSIQEVSAIAHDITEKKQSEIALIESERKFRNIFESLQDIYYHANLDGIITLISPSIEEILGYRPEEIIGRSISDFIVSEEGNLQSFVKHLLREKRIKNFESTFRTRNGAFIQCISNIRVVYDEHNRALGIEGVMRDITDLKKAAVEVLRAKELAEKSLK
ncbi:MAG: PAS domain S-box protein, partial [Bacteroidota bacterium]